MISKILGVAVALLSGSVALAQNPEMMNCTDRDSGKVFIARAQGDNVFRFIQNGTTSGFFAAADIFQDEYPLMITSVQSDADGKDLIKEMCGVNLKKSSFIEVLIAKATDTDFEKVRCLACVEWNLGPRIK